MSKPFKAEELRIFTSQSDRTINPFFVGRDAIINAVDTASQDVRRRYQEKTSDIPAEGWTQLIQGAPGIGKTSLLTRMRMKCLERLGNNVDAHKIIPVFIATPDDLTPVRLNTEIRQTIRDITPLLSVENAKRIGSHLMHMVGTIAVEGISISLSPTAKSGNLPRTDCTILLLIDEIQNLALTPQKEPAMLMRRLHGGSGGYPILPVLAGLSNSMTILQQHGLSRLTSQFIHRVPALTRNEVQNAVEMFIDHFNIPSTPTLNDAWTDRIASWTNGWPKHLQNTMGILGAELLLQTGDLSTVDPERVKRRAARSRVDYYQTRFGPLSHYPRILGDIMAAIPSGPQEIDTIGDILAAKHKQHGPRLLAAGLNPREVNIDFLLRYGLIDMCGNDEYHCPIPSLHSYAVARTGSRLHRAVHEGNLAAVDQYLEQGEDVDARDAWGRTPLHLATAGDWSDVVQVLLDAGANPECRDHRDRRPLDIASACSDTQHLLVAATSG